MAYAKTITSNQLLGEIGEAAVRLRFLNIGFQFDGRSRLTSQRIWTASSAIHSKAIRLTEHATVYFLEPSENQRLRKTPPDRSVMLMNRWYEGQDPYKRSTLSASTPGRRDGLPRSA
jgi:hypothetical protein